MPSTSPAYLAAFSHNTATPFRLASHPAAATFAFAAATLLPPMPCTSVHDGDFWALLRGRSFSGYFPACTRWRTSHNAVRCRPMFTSRGRISRPDLRRLFPEFGRMSRFFGNKAECPFLLEPVRISSLLTCFLLIFGPPVLGRF